jgi:hypothetical protein
MSSVARQYTTTTDPAESSAGPRLVPAESVIATRPAIPVSVLFLGIVAMLVAAWGAVAPFAGPEFGFVADRAVAWQWSVTSACLGLGPGAVAFVAALVLVAALTRTSYARRADVWFLGFVVTLCGAWFVVGQYAWPVIYGRLYIAPSNATHFMWKELAFAIGPGVILVFCGAVFMGWAVRRQLALVADRLPRAVAPGSAGTVTAQPRATTPVVGNAGTMAPPEPVAEPVAVPVATEPVVAQGPVAETPLTDAPPTSAPVVTAPQVDERGVAGRPVATEVPPARPVELPTGSISHPTGRVEHPTGLVETRSAASVDRAGEVAPPPA